MTVEAEMEALMKHRYLWIQSAVLLFGAGHVQADPHGIIDGQGPPFKPIGKETPQPIGECHRLRARLMTAAHNLSVLTASFTLQLPER